MKTTIELEEWFKETYDEELLILQSDSGIEDEGSFMAAFGGEAGSNVVTFTMRFVSKTERDQSIFEIAEDVRQHVANIPGIYNYNVDDSGGGLGGGAPIEIRSEERRVGKECRSRVSREHVRKKEERCGI